MPLKICIKGEKTQEYVTDIDVTKWLPGEYEENILMNVPSEFLNGEYELQIAIGGGDKPSVAFANEMDIDDTWFVLGNVNIH